MKNKKKILFLIPSLFGGGSERFTVNAANNLSKENDVYIAYYIKKKKSYKIDPKVKILKLQSKNAKIFFLKLIFYLIKNNNFKYIFSSIVHINVYLIILNILFLGKFKTIIRETNTPIGELKYHKNLQTIVHFMIRIFYNFAYKIVSPTNVIKNQLVRYFFIKKDKIVTIFNFIDITQVLKLSKKKPLREKKSKLQKYIVCVGSLTKQKNHLFLIKAFSKINPKKNIQLLIIGEGYLKNKIKKFINIKNIKNIKLVKNVINPFYYLKNSQLVVSTSLWEGLPNSLIESSLINSNILSFRSISGPEEIKKKGISIDIFNYRNTDSKKIIRKFSRELFYKFKKKQKIKTILTNKEILENLNHLSFIKLNKLFN